MLFQRASPTDRGLLEGAKSVRLGMRSRMKENTAIGCGMIWSVGRQGAWTPRLAHLFADLRLNGP